MRQLAAAIGTTRALMGPRRKIIEDCPPDPPVTKARRTSLLRWASRREPVVARR